MVVFIAWANSRYTFIHDHLVHICKETVRQIAPCSYLQTLFCPNFVNQLPIVVGSLNDYTPANDGQIINLHLSIKLFYYLPARGNF